MPATSSRTYPEITGNFPEPVRPISFVCVRFSGEFQHNILKSDCVHNPLNQFIVIDNRLNLFYPNLSAALLAGMEAAKHELICLVHEDVVLLPGWQAMFEASLTKLERQNPNWGMVGAVGWSREKKTMIGHYSDPHLTTPKNTFGKIPYTQVVRLDEQILVLRKRSGVTPDPDLPSIHNIGKDLARMLRKKKMKTFAINAPTIHKYADSHGNLIEAAADSHKIRDRRSRTYMADRDLCDEYFKNKWGLQNIDADYKPFKIPKPKQERLDAPLILLGPGENGTHLATRLAQDCGVFTGNKVHPGGASLEFARPVYRCFFRRQLSPTDWHINHIVPDLRRAAKRMLSPAGWPSNWGFNIPESSLILDDLQTAFPKAKYLYFRQDPFEAVFQKSRMSALTGNHIGRVRLKAAYDHFGLKRRDILTDGPLTQTAVTTVHQHQLIAAHLSKISNQRKIAISFKTALADPAQTLDRLADFLNTDVKSTVLIDALNSPDAKTPDHEPKSSDAQKAIEFLKLHAKQA